MFSTSVRWTQSLAEDPGGTTAWLVSLSKTSAQVDPTERDVQEIGARRGRDADRFLKRRALLRGLIARRCGVSPRAVEIGYDATGRPLVLEPAAALFCSVSARGDLGALALSPYAVGVDIEPLEPGEIPWAVFAAEEAADLRALFDAARLAAALRLWTVKEAFLKARGSGLLSDPATVAVSGNSLRAGGQRVQLDPSVARQVTIDGTPVLVACVALAALGAAENGGDRL